MEKAQKIEYYVCHHCQQPICKTGVLIQGNLLFLTPHIDVENMTFAYNTSEMGPVDFCDIQSVALCRICLTSYLLEDSELHH